MNTARARAPRPRASRPLTPRRLTRLALAASLLLAACADAPAQKPAADATRRKLPSAEKIVGDYLKAAGGKKRLAAVADAAYEWTVVGRSDPADTATSHAKAPSSVRLSVNGTGGELSAGVTPRAAWTRGPDGAVRTLTDASAKRARLRATLEASRLVDFKKRNLLAVTLGAEQVGGEQAYAVEFRPRNRSDEILSKIVGLVWIDLAEKVVMRIEARLTGDFRVGGGLLMKIAPGAGFSFERRRLDDGYWVPRSYHWNANGKGFLVIKRSVYEITEWDNYKRFRTESGDAKLDAPKPTP